MNTLRPVTELDMVLLENSLERLKIEQLEHSISIVSETYGPLLGYVPHHPIGRKDMVLGDGWFNPLRKI